MKSEKLVGGKINGLRFFYKNVSLDDHTKDYIIEKIGKMEKVLAKPAEGEVEISQDKRGWYRLEVMAKTPHNLYRAEETSRSVKEAIDVVSDQIQRQIRRDLKKSKDLCERGARSIKKNLVLDEKSRFKK